LSMAQSSSNVSSSSRGLLEAKVITVVRAVVELVNVPFDCLAVLDEGGVDQVSVAADVELDHSADNGDDLGLE
jgi:hypothetical protein